MSETGEADSFAQVATTTSTIYRDMYLAPGTQRWYFVVATDAEGHRSGGSNIATATAN